MRRRFRFVPLTAMLAVAFVVSVVFLSSKVDPAVASSAPDDGVPRIGVSASSSTAMISQDPAEKFDDGAAARVAEQASVSSLSATSRRTSYEVRTIGPEEAGSLQAGASLEGDTLVVTRDEGWQVGQASAYSLATNTGWNATASGVKLTEHSMTVAVPADRLDLLGKTCEIYYNGMVVRATVTDTGGFASYGRDLDLAGGVWRAFGASSTDEWGVREVSYRFVD